MAGNDDEITNRKGFFAVKRAINAAVKTAKMWAALLIVAALVWAGMHFLGPDLVAQVSYAVESGKVEAARNNLERLSRFDRMSALFREVSKTVKPAVVEIHVVKKATMRLKDLLRRRFGDGDVPMPRRWRRLPTPRMGLGSGVIIDAKNGYILTNEHVISGADKVTIVLADRRRFDVVWTRPDPASDLAVVKIKPDRLIEAPLGNSDEVEVGDWVLAVGAPQKLPQTVTAGIISATGRMNGDPSKYQNYLQTDAAINYGNSGGPLVNLSGEVMGINTIVQGGVGGGFGFAIPSDIVDRVAVQLIETGVVSRAWLGISMTDLTYEKAQALEVGRNRGALVEEVFDDSPAERAGIKRYDVIVAVDGDEVSGSTDVVYRVSSHLAGDELSVTFVRSGKEKTKRVETGERSTGLATAPGLEPDEEEEETAGSPASEYGMMLAQLNAERNRQLDRTEDAAGVFVSQVVPSAPAHRAGIRAGDVLIDVDGKAVTGPDQVVRALEKASKEYVPVTVERDGRQRFVALKRIGGE